MNAFIRVYVYSMSIIGPDFILSLHIVIQLSPESRVFLSNLSIRWFLAYDSWQGKNKILVTNVSSTYFLGEFSNLTYLRITKRASESIHPQTLRFNAFGMVLESVHF